MALKPLKDWAGRIFKKVTGAQSYSSETEGYIYNQDDQKLKTHIGGADREIATLDQTQSMSNKTLETPVVNGTVSGTAIKNEADMVSNSASHLATQQSIKAYVDTAVAGKDEASEITYSNATSGLTATDVQAAVDEVEGRVDSAETNITNHLNDTVDAHDASAVSYVNTTSGLTATDAQAAIDEVEGRLDTAETGISNHLADAVDAHDASAISYVNTTSGLTATDAQAAIDEIEGRVDTLEGDTGLADHLADTVDAHDASAISNVPSGNLASTDVQAALNELQSDVDTRATSSTLTTHTSDTTNPHSVTAAQVGNTTAQWNANQLYGKNIDNLGTTPPTDGQVLVWDAATSKFKADDQSGGGSLDIFFKEDFKKTRASDFTSGDSAVFDNGGTATNTPGDETTSPISGTNSINHTQGATSLDEWAKSPAIALDSKQKANLSNCIFYATYNGNDDDYNFVVKADSTIIAEIPIKAGTNKRHSLNFYIPSGTSNLYYGYHVKTLNSGKKLVFDDVEFTQNPYVDIGNISEMTDWVSYTPTFTGFGTVSVESSFWRRVGDSIEITTTFDSGSSTATEARISLPTGLTSSASKLQTLQIVGLGGRDDASTATYYALAEPSVSYFTLGIMIGNVASFAPLAKQNGNTLLSSGQTLSITAKIPIEGWSASSEHVVTPQTTPKQYSEANGDFTITGTGWTTGSAKAWYYIGGDGSHRLKFNIEGTSASESLTVVTFSGVTFKNESGIYHTITGGTTSNTWATAIVYPNNNRIDIQAGTTTTNKSCFGDVELESKPTWADDVSSVYLGVVPVPKTCYLKDIKSSGTHGGTFTSGSWQTRTLNTIEGDSSVIVSLSSNQFTLNPGTYEMIGSAPARGADSHRAAILDVTHSSVVILGTSEQAPNGSAPTTRSHILGTVTVTEQSVFEFQHRGTTTVGTNGFGPATGFGDNEVYAELKITRVK